MRHFPACCSDCQRLWLVSTTQAPAANPKCPRCGEHGRLVPGAYYSDPGARIFNQLEAAVQDAKLGAVALMELGSELERVLPSPLEPAIDAAYRVTLSRLGLEGQIDGKAIGKRVALRMVVTIASALSQPQIRESGVMRLPQTIPGLFDLVPKRAPAAEPLASQRAEVEPIASEEQE